MSREPTRRPDFSRSLVHLTKERLEYSSDEADDPFKLKLEKTVSAFDVLKDVLASGSLRAGSGYVKGSRAAVCLSEIPLSAMHHFAKAPAEADDKKKYRFYGIALSKRAVFDAGGRPVIYLPDKEAQWIPAEEKWRHVRFEYGSVDWTHEREWRVPNDIDLRKVPGIYVIVWSATEAKEIATFHTPLADLIRGVLPMENIGMML